jgi:2-methylcitrate dehydratase PrpD
VLDVAAQGDGIGTFPMPGVVTVLDRSGRSLEKTVVYVKGHPKNPMGFEDVANKFRACAGFGRPTWRGADEVIEAVRHIESMLDTGALARMCIS